MSNETDPLKLAAELLHSCCHGDKLRACFCEGGANPNACLECRAAALLRAQAEALKHERESRDYVLKSMCEARDTILAQRDRERATLARVRAVAERTIAYWSGDWSGEPGKPVYSMTCARELLALLDADRDAGSTKERMQCHYRARLGATRELWCVEREGHSGEHVNDAWRPGLVWYEEARAPLPDADRVAGAMTPERKADLRAEFVRICEAAGPLPSSVLATSQPMRDAGEQRQEPETAKPTPDGAWARCGVSSAPFSAFTQCRFYKGHYGDHEYAAPVAEVERLRAENARIMELGLLGESVRNDLIRDREQLTARVAELECERDEERERAHRMKSGRDAWRDKALELSYAELERDELKRVVPAMAEEMAHFARHDEAAKHKALSSELDEYETALAGMQHAKGECLASHVNGTTHWAFGADCVLPNAAHPCSCGLGDLARLASERRRARQQHEEVKK